jgi:hypothetical protein
MQQILMVVVEQMHQRFLQVVALEPVAVEEAVHQLVVEQVEQPVMVF